LISKIGASGKICPAAKSKNKDEILLYSVLVKRSTRVVAWVCLPLLEKHSMLRILKINNLKMRISSMSTILFSSLHVQK
jgi:hypothetical protein